MRHSGIARTLLYCAGLLVVLPSAAHAGIPSWVDNNPANAPRLWPSGGCGCGGGAYGGCAYGGGGCGGGPCGALTGCGAEGGGCYARHCRIGDWFKSCRMACLARRCQRRAARCCASLGCGCDGGCGACGCDGGCGCGTGCGCGGGGCADGGCAGGGCAGGGCGGSGCSLPAGSDDAGGDTIYDGPAAAEPEAIPPSETRSHVTAPYQLVSNAQPTGAGKASFKKGLAAYRSHGLTEALSYFEMAATDEPENAIYHYYLALTFQELYGADAGLDVLNQAVQLEQRKPITDWGKRMERVQGRSRLWIEKARRQAGLTR